MFAKRMQSRMDTTQEDFISKNGNINSWGYRYESFKILPSS